MEGKTLQKKKNQSNRMKLQKIEQSTKPIVISFVNKQKGKEKNSNQKCIAIDFIEKSYKLEAIRSSYEC